MKSCIVKRKITFKSIFPLLLIFIAALALMLVFKSIAVLFLVLGAISLFCLAPSLLFTEYEYNLEAEEFTVALIRNKSTRKVLFGCDIAYLVKCEPYQNSHISGEKLDFSVSGITAFTAVFSEEGKTASVIFSPNDEFVRELRLLAPSKVKLNIM